MLTSLYYVHTIAQRIQPLQCRMLVIESRLFWSISNLHNARDPHETFPTASTLYMTLKCWWRLGSEVLKVQIMIGLEHMVSHSYQQLAFNLPVTRRARTVVAYG